MFPLAKRGSSEYTSRYNPEINKCGEEEIYKFQEVGKNPKTCRRSPFTKHPEVCKFMMVEKILQENEYTYCCTFL